MMFRARRRSATSSARPTPAPATAGAREIRAYLGSALDGLDGAFDFPLMWAARDAIAHDARGGFDALETRSRRRRRRRGPARARSSRTCIDNHDTTRFLSEAAGDAGGDPWSAAAAAADRRRALPPPAARAGAHDDAARAAGPLLRRRGRPGRRQRSRLAPRAARRALGRRAAAGAAGARSTAWPPSAARAAARRRCAATRTLARRRRRSRRRAARRRRPAIARRRAVARRARRHRRRAGRSRRATIATRSRAADAQPSDGAHAVFTAQPLVGRHLPAGGQRMPATELRFVARRRSSPLAASAARGTTRSAAQPADEPVQPRRSRLGRLRLRLGRRRRRHRPTGPPMCDDDAHVAARTTFAYGPMTLTATRRRSRCIGDFRADGVDQRRRR